VIQFSYFAVPDLCSAVPKASGPIFMFCAPRSIFGGGIEATDLIFLFRVNDLIFDGTECASSSFHVLRSRTRHRRYRGCRVPFLYFALPDSFSTVPRASGPVF
jgi:hypothetical protein